MARPKKTHVRYPSATTSALKRLGSDLAIARKKRNITIREMALRMMVSPTTVIKLEKGDSGVSLGSLALALWILGMIKKLENLLPPEADSIGLMEDRKTIRQRARKKKSKINMDF